MQGQNTPLRASRHLQRHLLRHPGGEAHLVVGARQQAVEVRLAVQEPEVDLQEVLDVPGVLQDRSRAARGRTSPSSASRLSLCVVLLSFDPIQPKRLNKYKFRFKWNSPGERCACLSLRNNNTSGSALSK